MNKKFVYMDYAATTPTRQEVLDEMLPYFVEKFGNPSSVYKQASLSKKAIAEARENVARLLNADAKEIFFTSSGTESDNWAFFTAIEGSDKKTKHVITTVIEHPAIISYAAYLEKKGVEVTRLSVDDFGLIDLEELKNAIKDNTVLISVMFANNEIGTVQEIKKIGAIAKEHGILFHTDAVQAACSEQIDVKEMNIDMLSLSAHKFGGPKGIACFYHKAGKKLFPFIHGGGQESSKRAGTENVPGIVGLGKAVQMAASEMEEEQKRLAKLRDKLIDGIMQKVPDVKLNGHKSKRLANNVNVSFKFVEGESILLLLDMAGIAASSGSACASGSLDPSHVLLAIGLSHETAHGSIRFSLGRESKDADVDYLLDKLPGIIQKLREISPIYQNKRD